METWQSAERIPQVFNLDQCSCGFMSSTTNNTTTIEAPIPRQEEEEPHLYAFDPRVLNQEYNIPNYTAGKRSVHDSVAFIRAGLPRFYVCISPCHYRTRKVARRNSKLQARRRIPTPYKTIPMKEVDVNIDDGDGSGGRLQRHVDVLGGGGRHLKAATLFLTSADSLLFRDHHYKDSLTDLGLGLWDWPNLKRCRLERCHKLESIFTDIWSKFPALESLWISRLPRLIEAWRRESYPRPYGDFRNLKHVQLEYCPRIISVFPSVIHLSKLEKLVIKSCPRLKHVFAPPSSEDDDGEITLSELKAMELLDLRSLESITSSPCIVSPPQGATSSWKLKVRGCWKLKELPKFSTPASATRVGVEIDGEPGWLKSLVVNHTVSILEKK